MTEEITTEHGLTEYTEEFLLSVNYPNVHMSWIEWEEEARNFNLTEEEIAELNDFLEQNNQLTQPVRISGKQCWFTQKEVDHIELIKQRYPSSWEEKVFDRMNNGKLLSKIY